ncbi:MAG TPA: hypothetical protein PLX97_02585 [Gemmatales bacterium]|nr:hypothetical protein [Gemmatales bacterium]
MEQLCWVLYYGLAGLGGFIMFFLLIMFLGGGRPAIRNEKGIVLGCMLALGFIVASGYWLLAQEPFELWRGLTAVILGSTPLLVLVAMLVKQHRHDNSPEVKELRRKAMEKLTQEMLQEKERLEAEARSRPGGPPPSP